VEKQSADGSLVPATRKTAENENDDDEDEDDWEIITLNTYNPGAGLTKLPWPRWAQDRTLSASRVSENLRTAEHYTLRCTILRSQSENCIAPTSSSFPK